MNNTEGRFSERSKVADNSHPDAPGQVMKSQPLPDVTMIGDMKPNNNSTSDRQVEEEVQYDGVSEARLKWKVDLLILPLLSSVFFLSTLVSELSPYSVISTYACLLTWTNTLGIIQYRKCRNSRAQ
jgi:hypothetical protein